MKGSMLAMNKNRVVLASFCILAGAVTFSACRDKQSTGLEYARNMYDPIAPDYDTPISTDNELLKSFNGHTAQTLLEIHRRLASLKRIRIQILKRVMRQLA